MGEAIHEWGLIAEGDRILVGVSGGKDSYTLLHLLRYLKERAPVRFDLLAFHLDQGHPGFPVERIREYLVREGYPHRIVHQDTFSLVMEKIKEGDTTCSLCSRYRRAIIYNQAVELACTKIALGHHREDAIETLLLNMFYSGQLKGMPARLRSDDGRNTVIRPMIYVPEEEIREFAELKGFPVVPCTLCNGTQRDRMARLLKELSAENPGLPGNLLAAMRKVVTSHLLDGQLSAFPSGRTAARTGAPSLPQTATGSATSS